MLLDRLSAAPPGGVALVCAPAGSGKTMLVRSWIEAAALTDRTGWVSVERNEHDAQRFWLAVNAALADAGGIVQRVDPAPSFRGDALVEKLLGDLGALEDPAALVIDDLHELRATGALRWLEEFLAALPSQLRVFLLSREDPGLGLHRLRLAGRLTEIRDADLRFTPEEAQALFRDANLALSDESARLLYERTEGWAAGLRLAAISLEHHPDPERFVTEFSGSERTVARYLLEEVLEQQPPDVRQLLLRTSILDRVSGPLADCLTGGSGCERILQELEDANAFVSSLDVARSWFRYHHLFADLLQLELRRIAPETIGPLHRAAAGWHEENGDPVEAVRHAQAAHDWPHAARLLTMNHVGLILDGRLATVRELLDAFPARLGAANPELAVALADVRLRDGAADDAATYIAAARGVAATVPVERRGAFEMQLASVELEAASRRGDLERTREAMRALERALLIQTAGTLEQSHDIRALATMSLGIAELWALEVDDARRHLEEALALARRIGRPYLEIGCLAHLAIAAPFSELSAAEALAAQRAGRGGGRGPWARRRSGGRARVRRGGGFARLARSLRRGRAVAGAGATGPAPRSLAGDGAGGASRPRSAAVRTGPRVRCTRRFPQRREDAGDASRASTRSRSICACAWCSRSCVWASPRPRRRPSGASPRTVWCGPKPAFRRPRWSSRRIGPSRRSSCSHP